jgi:hypothetical protein
VHLSAFLAAIPAGGITAGILVALFVIALLTGKLVTAKVYNAAREDRDLWRIAAQENSETIQVLQQRISELLGVGMKWRFWEAEHSENATLAIEFARQAREQAVELSRTIEDFILRLNVLLNENPVAPQEDSEDSK